MSIQKMTDRATTWRLRTDDMHIYIFHSTRKDRFWYFPWYSFLTLRPSRVSGGVNSIFWSPFERENNVDLKDDRPCNHLAVT